MLFKYKYIHTYILVLVIELEVAVALVDDQKHSTFVSTNCAPPVVDQKHTLNVYLLYIYTHYSYFIQSTL